MSAVPAPSDRVATSTRTHEWIAIAGLIALILVIAMLLHYYHGLDHDSQLYSFQAMAHLKPELLGQDVYLRFGSQDNYTVFSPLFAALISAVGLEPASALITLFSQIAFLCATWFLARQLMGRELAWLGLGIMLAVPGVFGANGLWNVFEGFATPRLFCEALTIAALSAAIARRFVVAGGILAVAFLIHPLMALAGVCAVLYLRFAPLPRRLVLTALLVGVSAAAVVQVVLPQDSSWRIADVWIDFLADRQPFLFLTSWFARDWARVGVYVTTLMLGLIVLRRGAPLHRVCAAAVVITVAGIAISLIGGDLMRLGIVLQGQAWRWMWIGTVFAALLSPAIALASWELGPLGKLAAGLTLVTWLAIDEPYTILLAPVALACAGVAVRGGVRLSEKAQRLLLTGMLALLALVTIRSIANALLTHEGMPNQTDAPHIVRMIRDLSRDGWLPAAVVGSAWWLLTQARSRAARAVTAAACLATCAALVPVSAREWQVRQFPQSDIEAFGAWRALIPAGEEVFWIQGSVSTWVLLERPRYLTNNQMASVLFSDGARRELRRRARQIAPFASNQPYLFWREDKNLIQPNLPLTLENLCAAIDARFIVTPVALAPEALADAPAGASSVYRGIKLYRCAD